VSWHCQFIPNADQPLVVCEREELMKEIDLLRSILRMREQNRLESLPIEWGMTNTEIDRLDEIMHEEAE
jgi:hypothetical protein